MIQGEKTSILEKLRVNVNTVFAKFSASTVAVTADRVYVCDQAEGTQPVWEEKNTRGSGRQQEKRSMSGSPSQVTQTIQLHNRRGLLKGN